MTPRAASPGWAGALRLGLALVAAAVLAGVLPGRAVAHAVLQHTSPHQNAAVSEAPTRVQLDFNEPVEISFGALRVFDGDGRRVDSGKVAHVPGRSSSVTVDLRAPAGRDIYTTTYRVVSADGHPVSGGFTFGVGEPVTAERGTPQVADLLARSSAGPAVEGAYGAVRGLHYGALLLIIGAVAFRLAVWPAGSLERWPARLLIGAAGVGLLCALAGVALQGALGAGVGLGRALEGQVLEGSLKTRTGEAWLLRAAAWTVVLAFVVLYRSAPSRREVLGLAVPGAVLVATLPWAGHAETQSPQAVLVPADVVHILAAGVWLGGLVLLVVTFWPRRRGGEAAGGAAEATARFSRLALPAMGVLVVAGAVQSWFYLGAIGGFFRSTYGWALLGKIALLAAVLALAAANRRRTAALGAAALPEGPVARKLRSAMRGELALAVVVLGATATLVRAAPPATLNSGPVVRELDLGPMRVQLDIEPGAVGPSDYHLYLFDRRTGAQIDRVEELRVRLVQPDKGIGPITLDIPRKGPAHYELRNARLGVSGGWEATVTARVSEFDEYSAVTRFAIRGR